VGGKIPGVSFGLAPQAAEASRSVRLERAIGVIYRPRPDVGATTPVRAWRISSTLSSTLIETRAVEP
jgi:hypothetical protein